MRCICIAVRLPRSSDLKKIMYLRNSRLNLWYSRRTGSSELPGYYDCTLLILQKCPWWTQFLVLGLWWGYINRLLGFKSSPVFFGIGISFLEDRALFINVTCGFHLWACWLTIEVWENWFMMIGISTLANHGIAIFVFQNTKSNFKYSRSTYELCPVTTQSLYAQLLWSLLQIQSVKLYQDSAISISERLIVKCQLRGLRRNIFWALAPTNPNNSYVSVLSDSLSLTTGWCSCPIPWHGKSWQTQCRLNSKSYL